MPQEIVVLRCKECLTFQTHISKKSIKYNCKICGEKQSISRVYAKGTGSECRRACQHLNTAVPTDGDSEDVDRELDRYEDEQHRLKIKSLKRHSSDSPTDDQPDSDEMLANEEDFESEDAHTDVPSDSPTSDTAQDEGFEEKNLIPDAGEDVAATRSRSAEVAAETSTCNDNNCSSSNSAAVVTSVMTDTISPPVAKKSKYSLF